ncbi:MAG: MBL fold metallo-hydrolase [Pseudomonadota bacterium]
MMKLKTLNNRVFACIGEKKGDHIRENAGFIISPNGVVVIDTCWTLQEASWMYQQIRSVTEKNIIYVINTHHHPDHVFGNQIFQAPVIASKSCFEYMRSLMKTEWTIESLKKNPHSPAIDTIEGLRIVLPEVVFHSRMTLNLTDLELEIVELGGHSLDSTIVYLPKEKILFASDLLFVDRYPTMRSGNFKDWINSLEYLKKLDANVIVPGHGRLCGIEEVQSEQDYLIDLELRIKKLKEMGLGKEEIAQDPSIPKYWVNDYNRLHKVNIMLVYDQLFKG